MKTFIHIGFPKSASTFMQKKVFPSNDNINFIKDDSFYEYMLAHPQISNLSRRKFLNAYIKKYFSEDKINVLSAEMFVMPSDCLLTHRKVNDWKKFLDNKKVMNNLRDLPIDFEIIMIIRNQRSWLISWYQERIKRLETRNFNKWLTSKDTKNTLEVINYFRTINLWRKFFKNKKITIIPFEKLKKDPDKFIKEISKILKTKIKIDDTSIVKSSISKRGIIFKRNMNILGGMIVSLFGKSSFPFTFFWKINKKLLSLDFLISKLFKSKINYSLDSRIAREYEKNNKLLDKHNKFNLKEYGYFNLNSKR